jgi:ribonuclease R
LRKPPASRRRQQRPPADRSSLIAKLRDRGVLQEVLRRIARDARLSAEEASSLPDHCNELLKAGVLALRKGRVFLVSPRRLKSGRLRAHADGYAFVITDDPQEEDYYVPRGAARPAMHGDRVLALLEPHRGRTRTARIVSVLNRGTTELVGTYHSTGRFGRLQPAEERITYFVGIRSADAGGAADGDLVVAAITAFPTAGSDIEATVMRVLGPASEPRVQTEAVIAAHDLPTSFPPTVLAAAARLPQTVSDAERGSRLDLRKEAIFTIDGENARDFDDAVGLRQTRSGTRLWVSVADVAHYVPPASVLDVEAAARGTSVYFPDRVLPMLPEALSNGTCSLLPGKDRLTKTVVLEFDPQGRVLGTAFHDSVTRSAARLTYTDVKKMLVDEDKETCSRHPGLLPILKSMAGLAAFLYRNRQKRGSIDFDLPEADVVLDLTGRPEAIVRAERHIGHRIIEEFMLAANEAVARHLIDSKAPFLYRVHEAPDEDAVEELRRFLASFGVPLAPARIPLPKDFQKVLEATAGRPEERLIHTLLLRSMKQARYASEQLGHFGLATAAYTHFTSPIRRYPDLVVHRILRECMDTGELSRERRAQLLDQLPAIAEHSSRRERIAMEAERDVIELKKVEFMQSKIGEIMPGFVSGVLPFGFFVELADDLVEGLVHVASLRDDDYVYVERAHLLRGRSSGRVFRLGDAVQVRVTGADPERRRIDFALAEDPPPAATRKPRSRRRVRS